MLKNILWGMLNICDLHLIKSQSVYVDLSMPEDKKRAQQKYKNKQLFQKSERKGDQVSGLLCPKLTELLYKEAHKHLYATSAICI